MKTFYIQVLVNGWIHYVSSFAANSDQMAFEISKEKSDAILFDFTHGSAVAAMLGTYGHKAQILHV